MHLRAFNGLSRSDMFCLLRKAGWPADFLLGPSTSLSGGPAEASGQGADFTWVSPAQQGFGATLVGSSQFFRICHH